MLFISQGGSISNYTQSNLPGHEASRQIVVRICQVFLFFVFLQERECVWPDSQADQDLRQRDAGDAVWRRLCQRGLCEYGYAFHLWRSARATRRDGGCDARWERGLLLYGACAWMGSYCTSRRSLAHTHAHSTSQPTGASVRADAGVHCTYTQDRQKDGWRVMKYGFLSGLTTLQQSWNEISTALFAVQD